MLVLMRDVVFFFCFFFWIFLYVSKQRFKKSLVNVTKYIKQAFFLFSMSWFTSYFAKLS